MDHRREMTRKEKKDEAEKKKQQEQDTANNRRKLKEEASNKRKGIFLQKENEEQERQDAWKPKPVTNEPPTVYLSEEENPEPNASVGQFPPPLTSQAKEDQPVGMPRVDTGRTDPAPEQEEEPEDDSRVESDTEPVKDDSRYNSDSVLVPRGEVEEWEANLAGGGLDEAVGAYETVGGQQQQQQQQQLPPPSVLPEPQSSAQEEQASGQEEQGGSCTCRKCKRHCGIVVAFFVVHGCNSTF
jgi:hypothetical protein